MNIAIIGAGASGIMAAITAAENGCNVVVYEKEDKPLKKLLLTGNGKCNFTNINCEPNNFHLKPDDEYYKIICGFSNKNVIDFFNKIGIKSINRNGYYYPESFKAEDVCGLLLKKCNELNISIHCKSPVENISDLLGIYDYVIVSAGSRASFSDVNAGGYRLLEKFGVKYSYIKPALCPVYSSDSFLSYHKGERILARVSLADSDVSELGEIQINKDNLSGIPILQISRYVSVNEPCRILLDFSELLDNFPDFLKNRTYRPEYGKIEIEVKGTGKFKKAQVCRGGVSDAEIDKETLRLNKNKRVLITGELLDVDGKCGGYNLQWAWSTGYRAGIEVSKC